MQLLQTMCMALLGRFAASSPFELASKPQAVNKRSDYPQVEFERKTLGLVVKPIADGQDTWRVFSNTCSTDDAMALNNSTYCAWQAVYQAVNISISTSINPPADSGA